MSNLIFVDFVGKPSLSRKFKYFICLVTALVLRTDSMQINFHEYYIIKQSLKILHLKNLLPYNSSQ